MASPATPSAPPKNEAGDDVTTEVTTPQAQTAVAAAKETPAATSSETASVEEASAEANPAEANPAEANPAEANPAEANPVETDRKPGKLVVLAGPSGVGKGTLLKRLLQIHPQMRISVSATTRQPRPGEVNEKDYFFLSREQFDKLVNENALLEWAEFAGNCYGTPKAPIEDAIKQGQQVILEIELLGARQVRKSFPEAKQIFILPPDAETLETRIRSRGQDSEAAINKRLSQAKVELAAADEFDLQIVNDDLEKALAELTAAIFE